MFTHEDAKRYYDRFGRKQDWQRLYESRALKELIEHASLRSAAAVFEFGCGTGRLAETLLERHLSPNARYLGVDVSTTMISLSRRRLERFAERAHVLLTSGDPRLAAETGAFDRFVSTYVLDLLSTEDIAAVLLEAHRVLAPGGLLGLVSLTHGFTLASRLVERIWSAVYSRSPSSVGGCRALSLRDLVTPPAWSVRHYGRISALGVASEVLVAGRSPEPPTT
jgi:ubiquinone/menaquinone biosynthesis C-methylase UbiE